MKTNQVGRSVAGVLAVSVLAVVSGGCASVFRSQVLYEAPQPGAIDSRYVMRLEKAQSPLTGANEVYPTRGCDLSEAPVQEMMTAMYRRFFKDPATFVPPEEASGANVVGAVVGAVFDGLARERERRRHEKRERERGPHGNREGEKRAKEPRPPPPPPPPGAYRPPLYEDGHPASMSEPRPLFSPEEIDALTPEFVRAFAELCKGEYLTLRTRAYGSQGRAGPRWNESADVTSVTIRFRPAGSFLGISHGAEITWDFHEVHGLKFRGKGNQVFTYTTRDGAVREEYDFLAVFPRKASDTDYWRVSFPVE
jgi:hypothetical protein